MKYSLLPFALGAMLAGGAMAQTPTPAPPPQPHPQQSPPMGSPFMITPEERQELMKAREAALSADPALSKAVKDFQAEGQALQARGQKLQDQIRDAMIKADAKVAPIIAKIENARRMGGPAMMNPPSGSPRPPSPPPAAPHTSSSGG